jgi:pimeloyl-ACP methyl ester carboxylesterase
MNNSSNAPVIFINGLIGTLNDPKFHRPLGDRPVIAPDLNGYGARSDIRATNVDKNYKNTQNVRRFMIKECGDDFRFNREFMAWIRNDVPKTLGDVVDEWKRRQ